MFKCSVCGQEGIGGISFFAKNENGEKEQINLCWECAADRAKKLLEAEENQKEVDNND